MTANEALNKILADGMLAEEGDADEIIEALKHYGFQIVPIETDKSNETA